MYKRTAVVLAELKEKLANDNQEMRTELSALHESTEMLDKKLDKLLNAVSVMSEDNTKRYNEISERLNVLEARTDEMEDMYSQTTSASRKQIKEMRSAVSEVSKTISEVNSTSTQTTDKLTAMCTEMLAEYHRAVNDSINLLLANSMVSRIPDSGKPDRKG